MRLIEARTAGTDTSGVAPKHAAGSTEGPACGLTLAPMLLQGTQGGIARATGLDLGPGTDVCPQARCPRCGVVGPVETRFGYRKIDGKRRPQSWCRECRQLRKGRMVAEATAFARRSASRMASRED